MAMAQINPTVGDLKGNTAKITGYIERARSLKADLIAFTELAIPGYPPEDLLFKPQFIRDNLRYLDKVVKASRDIVVVVGFADEKEGKLYNAAALAYDGRLVDVYHKMFLPNYGVFDEKRYFEAGRKCPVYTINGVDVGVNVCEDIWYEVGPTNVQCSAGAELIININGSPYYAGKSSYRHEMLAKRAVDNQAIVSYTNMVGGQDELVFDGGSVVFDHEGKLLLRGNQFREELLFIDLEMDALSQARRDRAKSRLEDHEALKEMGEPVRFHVSGYTGDGCQAAAAPAGNGGAWACRRGLPGAGHGNPRLRDKERLSEGGCRPFRRHRLVDYGGDRCGGPGQGERGRRYHALSLLFGRERGR